MNKKMKRKIEESYEHIKPYLKTQKILKRYKNFKANIKGEN